MAQPTIHVSVTELNATHVELSFWTDNENQARTATVSLDDIAALIQRTEYEYFEPNQADLASYGRTLYRWLDGPDRLLENEINKLRGAGPVALAIEASQRLAHLPWETLHDSTSFLVASQNPPIVPFRWTRQGQPWPEPRNHALKALFMATSPLNVHPELKYEAEEAQILEATNRLAMTLDVEESGNLDELRLTATEDGGDPYDVVHLTGHGQISEDKAVFLAENELGQAHVATARDIANALPNRPNLIFLSACQSAQVAPDGRYRPLAEDLISSGFRAVLGWGKPVLDTDATAAASVLYRELSDGQTLIRALARAYSELINAKHRHWHLLRLFAAGGTPEVLVTRRGTPKRLPARKRSHVDRYLDAEDNVKVASRGEFVGRRRPLQRILRAISNPGEYPLGVLVQGMGGVGKSTVSARICDRLAGRFSPVILVGPLTEPRLVRVLANQLPDAPTLRTRLLDGDDDLVFRLKELFEHLDTNGKPPLLIVLDDFEQNLELTDDAKALVKQEPNKVFEALCEAVKENQRTRVLMTCRYRFSGRNAAGLFVEELTSLRGVELTKKQSNVIANKSVAENRPKELHDLALKVADGNPRLMEWVYEVLNTDGLNHKELLQTVSEKENEFRADALADALLATLGESARKVLTAALTYDIPVPFAAVRALLPEMATPDIQSALERSISLGLAERESHSDVTFRVSEILGPLLPASISNMIVWQQRACEVLNDLWLKGSAAPSEAQIWETLRLALRSQNEATVAEAANWLGPRFLLDGRNRQAKTLYETAMIVSPGDYRLVYGLARAEMTLGNGERASSLFKQALLICPADQAPGRGEIIHYYAERLEQEGQLDEVLRLLREEQIPLFERLGDARSRAVTMGKIADVLQARGELDEALRIRKEEQLPVYERLGDARAKAVTMGKIADVLDARGELDEALRIRKEQIPVFERLGDARAKAVVMGRVADVLQARGELDEALRIRKEEQLPVYKRLGDAREIAVTIGRVADVLQARGQLDEALRIRKEEQLPVYERLGDARSKAVTMGKIADVLYARGELDEALRIRKEEQLPVYERLGDTRAKAVVMGRIASVLQARGELDEALKIRKEEELPVFERLGDAHSIMICKANIAFAILALGHEQDVPEAAQLLLESFQIAKEKGYAEGAEIKGLLDQLLGKTS